MRNRASWIVSGLLALVVGCGSDGEQLFADPSDSADAGADVAVDGNTDAGGVEPGGPCQDASECKAPSHPCQTAVCVAGVCDTAFALPGTSVPAASQVEGDCQRIECGEGGSFAVVVDETDVPEDDGKSCTVSACDGSTPVHHPKEAGEACEAGGSCDGAGNCIGSGGECSPHAVECVGNMPRACDAEGSWQAAAPCASPYTCSGGACAIECVPGSKRCDGNIPQTCSATGAWESASECATGCLDGLCTGLCTAGAKRCVGSAEEVCDAEGRWVVSKTCESGCNGSNCDECTSGAKRCTGQQPEVCNAKGEWEAAGPACGDGEACQHHTAQCVSQPVSCKIASGNGSTWCSPTDDCCEAPTVPAGVFWRNDDSDYPAIVSAFRLGKRPVTVLRFQSFVSAVVKGYTPPVGSGKHGHLQSGAGLNGAETGWMPSWNAYLPKDEAGWKEQLGCSEFATYERHLGGMLPINCVNWYQAQAFCIWDGGFLPSETEWHYAASGGDEQRVFPWSSPATSTDIDATYAVYDCMGDGTAGCDPADLLRVGSKENGAGRWGHLDLSGTVSEWVADAIASYPATCSNCANLPTKDSDPRVIRGGSFRDSDVKSLHAVARKAQSPLLRSDSVGFRCAYSP